MELTVDGYLPQSRGKLIDCFAWLLYRLPKLEYFVVHILPWRKICIKLFLGGFIVVSSIGKGFKNFLGLWASLVKEQRSLLFIVSYVHCCHIRFETFCPALPPLAQRTQFVQWVKLWQRSEIEFCRHPVQKESVPSLVANVLSNWDYVRSDSYRFLRLLELTTLSLAHGVFIIHFSDHVIISDYIIMYY